MMNKESDGMGCHWDRAGLMVGYQYSKDFVVSAVYRHFWKTRIISSRKIYCLYAQKHNICSEDEMLPMRDKRQ